MNSIKNDFTTITDETISTDFMGGLEMGKTHLTRLASDINRWIVSTVREVCPGGLVCSESLNFDNGIKCITEAQMCDGKFDCELTYQDEISCSSGAYYDVTQDPYRKYYADLIRKEKALISNLTEREDLLLKTLADGSRSIDERNSWIIPDNSGKVDTVIFNSIDPESVEVQSLRWIIKASKEKVAVVRVPKTYSNIVEGGGELSVIVDGHKVIHPWTYDTHYYTSKSDGSITLMVTPISTTPFLERLKKSFMFSYWEEEQGACMYQHKCSDGRCVSPLMVCDGQFDCSDFSDEEGCFSGCHGSSLHVNESSVQLMSANYPHPHFGNGDCIWNIVAPVSNHGINDTLVAVINFDDFRTSPSDEFFVFVEEEILTRLYGKFSGNLGSKNFEVRAEKITLVMRSNDKIGDRRIKGRLTWTFK